MSAFTHISNKFRRAVAVAESIMFKTQRSRWRRVAMAGPPPWDERNKRIASLIPPLASVLDLGCGAQTLKGYLPRGCLYQPCDLIASSADVIVCDFNSGQYPTRSRRYDIVVCSGVLEYIREPREFLKNIENLAPQIVLSYNARQNGSSIIGRLANHWINHFSLNELEDLFRELSLRSELLWNDPSGEAAFRLQRSAEDLPQEVICEAKDGLRVRT